MQNLDPLNQLKNQVQDCLNQALKQGATAAEAGFGYSSGLSVSARLGDVENIEYDCDQGLSITVYVGKRKGSASSTDLSPQSIKETVTAACSIAKFSSVDECSGLPDEHLLATTHEDLELYHPWQLDAPAAIALAIECEDVARAYHPDISNSDGATVNSHQGIQVLGNTLGFLQGYQTTRHSLSCSVIGQRDDEMQRNYWYSVGRHANDLESPASIGKKAAERTLKRLGSRSLTTRVAPVLYAPEMAAGLLGALMSAISGGNLYRKTSFLLDSLETQILPDFIRIHEQPHLKRALGSSFFDSEGVATHSRDIVSAGVLKSYLLGSYSARKLAMQSTGNAGGVRNLTLAPGDDDFAAMLKRLDTGLLVTELMGNGINRLTGDYSRGAAGFWVENGQIQYPVEEITIAGNLKQMFKNIVAVGNDVDTRGNTRTGSILISQMSIAGK